MLHRDTRILMVGVLLLVSWQFLSLGAVVFSGGVLMAMDLEPAGITALASGAFFTVVGWVALRRLAHVIATPHY